MLWSEIRLHFPQTWLLIEALAAHSVDGKRILDDLSVFGAYSDSTAALASYVQMHRAMPERELYVFHTDREELDIRERWWPGIRPRRRLDAAPQTGEGDSR